MTPPDTSPPAPPRVVSPLRWWICILLFMATTLNYLDRISLNLMNVQIVDALKLTVKQYADLESAFSVAFAIGAITTGFIVDRVNVRFIYPLMVFGWSIAGILTGFANSFGVMLGCRLMLGFFEAGNWPCGVRTTRTIMKPEERSLGNSIFQSGTAAGAILTPQLILIILVQFTGQSTPTADSWQLPFRMIGCIGLGWLVLWFLTVPGRLLKYDLVSESEKASSDAHGTKNYWSIFRDRRFWALLAMNIAMNITWQTYRLWMPRYVQRFRGYTYEEMSNLSTLFYIVADVGAWTIGGFTLLLVYRGLSNHSARMLAYFACTGLALTGIIAPYLEADAGMVCMVLICAFSALGLFPTYFSLSQEISSTHQGKVTGTLGCGTHLFLSLVVYQIQGRLINDFGLMRPVMAASGVFPLIAFVLMLLLWRTPKPIIAPAAPDAK